MELEQEESPSGQVCEKCGRPCEPMEADRCPVCQRGFCVYCAHRYASRNFCSRACGELHFFGADDEAEEATDAG